MKIPFSKFEGTGNDFIIIDKRALLWEPTTAEVAAHCDRHYGIGADGLILLSDKPGFDFDMKYYNSDGRESTLCGNGGRCMVAMAAKLGLIKEKALFHAMDGMHEARILNRDGNIFEIRLKMNDSGLNKLFDDGYFIHTGSPHFIRFVDDVRVINVFSEGKAIRYEDRFAPDGVNVDFVTWHPDYLDIRTYERGVENETLSCGTGATAAALAAAIRHPVNSGNYKIKTTGGNLKISFHQSGKMFTDIWLEGPASFVFSGEIHIK